jgi:hypothetical protein
MKIGLAGFGVVGQVLAKAFLVKALVYTIKKMEPQKGIEDDRTLLLKRGFTIYSSEFGEASLKRYYNSPLEVAGNAYCIICKMTLGSGLFARNFSLSENRQTPG